MFRAGAVACALCYVLSAIAAAPVFTQELQKPPAFRVSTRLVQVSVVVHDRRGSPVTDLTAADFRVFEDGKAQPIELFSSESNLPADSAPALKPAADHEFTNRPASRPTGTVTAILFDRLNTSFADQALAREALLRFLREVRRDDRVAVYVLDSNAIRILHDFTGDAPSLVRTVSRYIAGTSPELAAAEAAVPESADPGDAAMQAFLEDSNARMTSWGDQIRGNTTITALESVARYLEGVSGRKNLVWLSGGFPLRALAQWGVTTEIQRATRALSDAQVALYSVDARGLIGAFLTTPGAKAPTFTTLSMVRNNLDILQITAEETGGRAFYNTNDISGAIRRSAEDARAEYVLGYYSSNTRWDGEFRRISVKVNRPDVEVRHRGGYRATPAPRDPAAVRQQALQSALHSPLEATAIGLTARVDPVQGSGSRKVTCRIDPRGITLEREASRWVGAIDVIIAQSLPDGRFVTSVDTTVAIRLTDAERADLLQKAFVITQTIALHGEALRLHIVVRDGASSATGSLVIPAERLQNPEPLNPARLNP